MIRRALGLFSLLTAVFVIAAVLAGCNPWKFPEQPVLLLNVDDWDNEASTEVHNVRLYTSNGEEVLITADVLEVPPGDEWYHTAGYTYLLNTGETYTKIIYFQGDQEITREITIIDAESGMVYFVNIG